MKTRALCIAVLCLFTAAGCASTAEQAPAADAEKAAAAQNSAANQDELICKKVKRTGSMRSTKVCATREEWEASEEDMTDWRDGLDSF